MNLTIADMSGEGLKKWAAELGVPNAVGLQRPQLETEIRSRSQQANPTLFASLQPETTHTKKGGIPWGAAITTVFSLAMMVLTAGIAWSNWKSATAATNLYSAELVKWQEDQATATDLLNRNRVDQWQTTIVHNIIDRNTKDDMKGISFDDIRMQYVAEATTAPHKIEVPRDKLETLELQRVLVGLETAGVVYHLADGRYLAKRMVIPVVSDKGLPEKLALYSILGKTFNESGKYTVAELGQLVERDTKVTPDEFQAILSLLMADTEIIIEEDKVWSGMKPPPKKDK